MRDDAHDRGDPRDPSAGRRLGAGPGGAAALPAGPRDARAGRRGEPPGPGGWQPKLVALDIDGTLFTAGHGVASNTVEETITPAVRAAIDRALDAGAHVVLATGRSTFGITRVLDMLELPRDRDRVLSVASNGSVTFAYPPVEVLARSPSTPRQVVRMLLEHVPQALVAVEEIGIGYRVNRHFPDGEITGEMTVAVDRRAGRRAGHPGRHPRPARQRAGLRRARREGRAARHQLLHRVDGLARPRPGGGVQGLRPGARSAERLGVAAADVLAIGDGRNDVEMLQWAGRGVAMGQAPLEVQEAADFVTATVEDDGAAMELDRWFP